LRKLGLEQYAPAFRDNAIDTKVLPSLTAEDLKDLGVTLVGHRRRLLDAIAALSPEIPAAVVMLSSWEAPARADAERRQLTVMFCDLVGSTALSIRFDPEDLRGVISAYHRAVTEIVTGPDGSVATFICASTRAANGQSPPKTVSEQHFAIDPDKIEEEKKFDGIFVLRTNTDLNPLEAMLCYKQLWTVEQTFRTAKHLLTTRPIFHKLDETIRGHVFCSFLALVLKTELEERIAALDRVSSWPEIIADLDSLTETEIEYDGKHFIIRAAPRPAASLALRAAGVALPPTIRAAAAS
jgi:hypothetical protein